MKATGMNTYEQSIWTRRNTLMDLLKILWDCNKRALIVLLNWIIFFALPFSTFLSSNQCKIKTKCHKSIAFWVNHTWNVSAGYPTIPPSQLKAWFINPRMARKAIRLAAMLATRPMEAEAPLLAASRMFCSSLGSLKEELGSKYWQNTKL